MYQEIQQQYDVIKQIRNPEKNNKSIEEKYCFDSIKYQPSCMYDQNKLELEKLFDKFQVQQHQRAACALPTDAPQSLPRSPQSRSQQPKRNAESEQIESLRSEYGHKKFFQMTEFTQTDSLNQDIKSHHAQADLHQQIRANEELKQQNILSDLQARQQVENEIRKVHSIKRRMIISQIAHTLRKYYQLGLSLKYVTQKKLFVRAGYAINNSKELFELIKQGSTL